MFKQNISFEVWGGENGKYRLLDDDKNPIDKTPEDTCDRVAKALSDLELPEKREFWYKEFRSILGTRFAGGGRIMANVGAGQYKKETSPINCVVMQQIPDSMSGIMDVAKDAALTLKAGCGVGYDFSTIRPKGSHVFGAGAGTSGVISFMKIFDAICSTILSGGARRGAQMACLDIQSPEIEDFITAKRQDGVLRYFNCSVLVTDRFMKAVEEDKEWDLWFWEKDRSQNAISSKDVCLIKQDDIPYNHSEFQYFRFAENHCEVEYGNCVKDTIFKKRIFKTVKAKELYDLIMRSTYNFWEPGFLLIDRANTENNLYFCEIFRATNPCGEQPLSPTCSCLLGSMILPSYILNPFLPYSGLITNNFDWEQFRSDIRIASCLLDNVVEINNLPINRMREQIIAKRRHGLGFTGLGSALNMLCLPYGSDDSLKFAEQVSLIIAQESLFSNIQLAKEKGCAPIFVTQEARKAVLKSAYLKRLIDSCENKEQIIKDILEFGLRYSHATSLAPTGTMSITWGNNCSGGIEPEIADSYFRNIRNPNKKTKTQEEVMSYSYFVWKEKVGNKPLPDYWRTMKDLSAKDHLNMQAVVQKWVDSSISKTINLPADYPFEDFKNIYLEGWKLGLKGVTTYRPNASIGAGVLTQKSDLDATTYTFTLEDGREVSFLGSETVEYDGESHNVANLFDALKEGIYGSM